MTPTDSAPLPPTRRSQRAAVREDVRRHSLLHYLAVSLSAAVLVLLLAVALVVIGLPALVGGSAMTVLTPSMEPRLPPGTLVVIRPTAPDDIRVGDVVTYQIRSGEAAVVSHRVVSKTYQDGELTFVTKGDNNADDDPEPVQTVQIRGKLWYSLPWLGWVNHILNGPHRPVVLAVAAGGLFLYAAGVVVSGLRERVRRSARNGSGDAQPAAAG
jgi:signal peptidase